MYGKANLHLHTPVIAAQASPKHTAGIALHAGIWRSSVPGRWTRPLARAIPIHLFALPSLLNTLLLAAFCPTLRASLSRPRFVPFAAAHAFCRFRLPFGKYQNTLQGPSFRNIGDITHLSEERRSTEVPSGAATY